MWTYRELYHRAVGYLGSAEAVEARLPRPKDQQTLIATSDDRYLAAMTMCVFQAGFVWRIVRHKWPGFEAAFFEFDPDILANVPDEFYDERLADARVIRNWQKLATIRHNAAFVAEVSAEHDGFGRFLAQWPTERTTALWRFLAERGARLGGNTGPYFLRRAGKDTFLLTRDVVRGCMAQGIIDKPRTSSWGVRRRIQAALLEWRHASGRSLAELSMLLALAGSLETM